MGGKNHFKWCGLVLLGMLVAGLPTARGAQGVGEQLNQLILLDNTPNRNDAGQFYATGEFQYLRTNIEQTYTFDVRGEYGITNMISVGGEIPVIHNDPSGGIDGDSHTDIGDITLNGQFSLDKILGLKHPEKLNVTGEFDVGLPTGSHDDGTGTSHLLIRPELLAYRDFGRIGEMDFSGYGLLGFDISTSSGMRLGFAGAFDVNHFTVLLEYLLLVDSGGNTAFVSPGVVFRGFKNWELAFGVPINLGMDQWGVDFKATFYWDRR